ncbi:hypothetical protein BDV38DRAFT_296192 [Aspergillus pseudotamarii]|uniref:Uncharacterized protein n=1 Tax=Aspergillus pseudotamarii TaxID=132259 RepID=A0A5N6T5Q0_ASPPS|nr:uncharacterized protein BDV38DRAFT_296192 [Aspergillus pseudotamarii]KAE8141511.1 hypothetical protein BDV38DRAFT_296192 [Aspergillus pseudotamarii]
MPSRRISRTPFLSSEEVNLGSLITNLNQPELGARGCPWPLGRIEDFAVRSVPDMCAATQPTKETGLCASFTRLFKFPIGSCADSDNMRPRGGKIYTLKKPRELFHDLSTDKGVKKWLQQQIGDKLDMYLVEGLATLEGNPSSSCMDSEESYPAQGELVCAMRLMKLVFNPFRTKTIESARLEKNSSWEVFSDSKALHTQAAEWAEVSSDGKESSPGDQDNQVTEDNDHGGMFTFDEDLREQPRSRRDEVSCFSDDS